MAPRISLAREPQAPPLGAFAPERLGRGAGAAGAASAAGGASAAGSATATGLGRAAPKEGAAVEAECASTAVRAQEMAAMLGALQL